MAKVSQQHSVESGSTSQGFPKVQYDERMRKTEELKVRSGDQHCSACFLLTLERLNLYLEENVKNLLMRSLVRLREQRCNINLDMGSEMQHEGRLLGTKVFSKSLCCLKKTIKKICISVRADCYNKVSQARYLMNDRNSFLILLEAEKSKIKAILW